MAVIGVNKIPEVLNDFNVYDNDGQKLVGISDSVTLSSMALMTQNIGGAGIGGEYAAPVVGHTQSQQQEIPFRILYESITKYMDHSKTASLTLRGAVQVTNPSTGVTEMVGVRYIIRGKTVEVNPGSAKVGDAMGASLKLEVLYEKLEVDGKTLMEHDKLNEIFVVNGVDIMDQVRRLC